MNIFGIIEAEHFCKSYSNRVGDSSGSLSKFFDNNIRNFKTIKENSKPFEDYRSCLLRDVERNLFLSISNYRRNLDLMLPSASAWSYTTIYYGTWFAAHSLLGMFGCAIFKDYVIDVKKMSPGKQELQIKRIGTRTGEEHTTFQSQSTHRIFWDLFYNSIKPIKPYLDPSLRFAISPISSKPTWQIDNRNSINYDSHEAILLSLDFQNNFNKSNFPSSLPGILNTQYSIFEALLQITFSYAKQFSINTDALSGFLPTGKIQDKIRRHIYIPKKHILLKQTKCEVFIKK